MVKPLRRVVRQVERIKRQLALPTVSVGRLQTSTLVGPAALVQRVSVG
jgi:hypothetical protein